MNKRNVWAKTTLAAYADAGQCSDEEQTLKKARNSKVNSFRNRTEFRTELNLKKEECIQEMPPSIQSWQF
jgi:hypothetical protein